MSKTNDRRRVCARVLFALVMVLFAFRGWAQTTNPEDEYKKLVKVDEEIAPLGDNPFGESVNVFNGDLSFHVVDITIPGRGPTIQISRTFQADGDAAIRKDNESFGDWDIDLPRFSTLTSNAGTLIQGPPQQGWFVNSVAGTDRCTTFAGPPAQRVGRPGSEPLTRDKWWNGGYLLRIPGVPDQDILGLGNRSVALPAAVPGLQFVGASKGNWLLSCLPTALNDPYGGEGFLAIGPDGSKYWLNYLAYRPERALTIDRRLGLMFATRMEDRFGNWLTYSYQPVGADSSNARITGIDASDGRKVTFTYSADGTAIQQVNVIAGGVTRTWTYSYATSASGQTLTGVALPDGSAWTYNLTDLTFDVKTTPMVGHCLDPYAPDETIVKTGTITAPSGLQGVFEARPTRHARADVPQYCDFQTEDENAFNSTTRYSNNLALRKKTVSGAGLVTQVWTYNYPLAAASWRSVVNVPTCQSSSYTDVVDPSNNTTRYYFSNCANVTEGKPERTEYYSGAATGGPLRIDTFDYTEPDHGPWPARFGSAFSIYSNVDREQGEAPLYVQHIQVNGDDHIWQASAFDIFARPTTITRSSSAGYSVQERNSFLDDYSHWVIGLPSQSENLTKGEIVSRNVYNPNSLTLSERYSFGRKVMGYAFNQYGELGSFTDGNDHTTTLGDYKRGIPQTISYPDGTSQSLAVDDFGQIASITNQAGAKTSYSYDAIGRLARIDYPAGDSVNWAPKTFVYSYIGDARGMGGPHWMRLATQGAWSERLDYDAMLRPVMYGTAEAGTGALYISSRTEYDWRGHKTFQSYPVNGSLDRLNITQGVATGYDALGRPTCSLQASELNTPPDPTCSVPNTENGKLATITQYLAGSAKRVIDPKKNITTSWYQDFDQPSYDNVVKVAAPEGVTQTITRDIYGNPLKISQGGIDKIMAYDPWHRLCRTNEPESGSEIMAYDGADNLAWSVSGAPFDQTAACLQDQVADAAKTIRTYDAMNRVTSVVYPAGTAPSTFTYDPLGNPATATSGSVSWTFGRNKLGLLTAEVLSVDGWNWGLGYGYDQQGALSTVRYPDGDVVAYNPDALKRPTTVGDYASGISYYPDGDAKSYYIGNGGIYSSDKNERNLLSNFTYGKGGVPNVSEDFFYDENGNVGQIKDVSGNDQRTKVMSYDGLNRLLSSTASNLWGTESYTYDTLNNIRSLTNSTGTNTYNYIDGTNRLNSITNAGGLIHSFQYDVRGNTTSKDDQILNFDLANRLVSIEDKGTYTYDAAGRRVKKVLPDGATTYYAYNSAGQLMWEADPATRLGSEYIYLGKKLVAKATENIDILKPSQVQTALSIIGVPQLSLDGTTIDITLDIANNGSRSLTANSQYPVQMGYHLIEDSFAPIQPEAGVNLPSDIPAGGHGTITMHVAAAAVLGTGKRIRFSLLQAGVAWFQDWPGNTIVDAGPYSACPTPGAGNLCNNVTGITKDQANVTLSVVNGPSLSADAQEVLTTIDIANHGNVTLASAAPHPIQLGNHLIDSTGAMFQTDVARAAIPEIPPGQHAAVTIATPASLLLGTNRRVQFELVQEGLHWFKDFGLTPLTAGPYVTIQGSHVVQSQYFTLSWASIAGVSAYNLRKRTNGGAWQTVQSSSATSSAQMGGPATFDYQLQACTNVACAGWGDVFTVVVALPPSTPDITVPAGSSGSVTVSWGPATGTTRFELEHSTAAGWVQVYSGLAYSTTLTESTTGVYYYRVRACNSYGCSSYMTSPGVQVSIPPSVAPAISGGGTNNSGAYSISWTPVAGATAYYLAESFNGGAWQQRQYTASRSWSATGKQNGTYLYEVAACNAGGCGPFSASVKVVVAITPPPPSGVLLHDHIVNIKRETLTLTWNSTPLATSFEVIDADTGIFKAKGLPATTLSLLVASGASGTLPYHAFEVRACNAMGCSAWAIASNVND